MNANEKMIKILEGMIADLKKDGYVFKGFQEFGNCHIFANQNYAEVNIELNNGLNISQILTKKDD